MFPIISRDPPKRYSQIRGSTMRYSHQQTLPHTATTGAPDLPARVLRALVLALVALIVIFVGLMPLPGRYEVGVAVIGSVLLIGLGAAQHARK